MNDELRDRVIEVGVEGERVREGSSEKLVEGSSEEVSEGVNE